MATWTGCQRRSARDNEDMPAVSQALIEFANHNRATPAPGIEVIDTERYVIQLMPDFPIPGPNNAGFVRCRPDEADEVIREVRAAFAPRRQVFMWQLDPGTEPANFAEHLAAHGVLPDARAPHADVMVLPVDAPLEMPIVDGLEIRDALADLESFRLADDVGSQAFGGGPVPDLPEVIAAQERRRVNAVAWGVRRHLLALVDGEPAGAAGMNLFPPGGAIINGGAVAEKFRGRGVYRAMVAARLRMAREAGVEGGLAVWGAHTSAPILARLGFEVVGWRKFYVDGSTA